MTKKPAKKSVKRRKKTAVKTANTPALIPQSHGGALYVGGAPGNAGGGRPPDAIRAKMRQLGYEKGLPFYEEVLDGKVMISLLGKCDECAHEQGISEEWVELLMARLQASRDDRLRVTDQIFKFGLQAKELVITSKEAEAFFEVVDKAARELFGDIGADHLKARAIGIMSEQ